ncbi:hypothetical protein NC651_003230 [Populus alba x Populus x berolinensis]|nr:hypothetical protein NC651_003230 [Populus alba x Populus x berolinensis]
MAAISKLSVVMSMIMIFANVLSLSSEPTIGASPAVLPYATPPNMSSFFRGEFVGKSSSSQHCYKI